MMDTALLATAEQKTTKTHSSKEHDVLDKHLNVATRRNT